MNEHTTCLIGDRPHPTTTGHLCDHHHHQLARMLRDIEDQAATLHTAPSLAVDLDHAHGATPAHERSPARLDPITMLDRRRGTGHITDPDPDPLAMDDTPSILDVLGSWARIVREERAISTPTRTLTHRSSRHHGPLCADPHCPHTSCHHLEWRATATTPATITTERALLTRHLDWIATQPWVDELYTDALGLLAALQRANNTTDLPVGRCTTLDKRANECGGDIRHHHIERPGEQPEPGFRCDRCRRTWTGTGALRLRDQLHRDQHDQREKMGA